MRYSSSDSLFDFEFHDAEFSLKYFEENTLYVTAKCLNIHKDAKENPYDYDMEIKSANISFENIQIHSFAPMEAYKTDDHTDASAPVYRGNEAKEKFITALDNGISINYIDIQRENERSFLEFCASSEIYFIAVCSAANIVIEWDEYYRKAWYEFYKQYRYDITLDTPIGEQKTEINIICHEEELDFQGKCEKAPFVIVGIKYGEKEIWGRGKDYLWIDAFADLQKQLPNDVKIKCCLTCRHGNLCPAGNFPNEVFCTKDVTIRQKSDLFFYTEDDDERKKRSRNYTFVCEDFKEQSDAFFTYSDYFCELEK